MSIFSALNEKIRGFLESKASLDDIVKSKKNYKRIDLGLHALNPLFKAVTYNPKNIGLKIEHKILFMNIVKSCYFIDWLQRLYW